MALVRRFSASMEDIERSKQIFNLKDKSVPKRTMVRRNSFNMKLRSSVPLGMLTYYFEIVFIDLVPSLHQGKTLKNLNTSW